MIEIDLDAIQNNVQVLKKRANTGFMAVVKANAYGHGAVRVAEAAIEAGADWLGVANIREGMQLRAAGISDPVLVLSEPEATIANVTRLGEADLTPTVYSKEFIELFAARSRTGAEVHLKVDVGMHRLGLSPSEALDMVKVITDLDLNLAGVYTHLSSAETSVKVSMVEAQRFDEVMGGIGGNGGMRLFHMLNTWGVLNFPTVKYDMVRCGLGMYGLIGAEFGLKPALSVKSRISVVRWLPKGSLIGYNGSYRMENDGYVGVVPVGYADGIPASSAGIAWVAVDGWLLPVIAVFMDMMVVGLGRRPGLVGAPVELVGKGVTVANWAEWLGLNRYEVVCGIGHGRAN